MGLYDMPINNLNKLIASGAVQATEVVEDVFDRIEQVEGKVRAYLTLNKEAALQQARRIDEQVAHGEEIDPLAGVPVALKDNICTKGLRTTCASRFLESFQPPYDATVVERLRARGAVILGKTNMDEFAMGSSCENSAFFPTHNPWDLQRVPGGSSGGSAAAVAAGEAVYALGSDTGGSVRQPAALCGVVGMKPTYGFVSRFGVVAFASSLDQIGPVTRNVQDCALVMNAICGRDPLDSTSADIAPPDFTSFLTGNVKGLRLGVPKEYFAAGTDPAVADAVRAAVDKLCELGAVAEECSLPHTEYGLSAYYIIATAEASSNLARYDGVCYGRRDEVRADLLEMYLHTRKNGFGPEVKRRIMLGTYALGSGYYEAYYLKAQKVRTLIRRDFEQAFQKYDVLVAPTSPTTAFKIGERTEDLLAMYMTDVCTLPVNLAGLPGISIPCGFKDGLPIGLQLIGRQFDDGRLLQAAYAFEQNTDFHQRRPQLDGTGR
ncbi:MAG TPA: Asp-tRNA(Asn)/Glu-tRNA(Gln) amidotransferase subunit GatA [Firmicutes bacterium]|nr:Asp-tRNA(Asn)/Glu-tRNA(Gln) amidotransferase subunit GatA [Bacillota bacterium]